MSSYLADYSMIEASYLISERDTTIAERRKNKKEASNILLHGQAL